MQELCQNETVVNSIEKSLCFKGFCISIQYQIENSSLKLSAKNAPRSDTTPPKIDTEFLFSISSPKWVALSAFQPHVKEVNIK